MRDRVILVVTPIVVCALIVCGFVAYQNFIRDKIFQESTDHLLATYEQVDKTFSLFSQGNWSVLADWDEAFSNAQGQDAADIVEHWKEYDQNEGSWHYSDFYLFNEDNDFLTVSGRQGRADSIAGAFDELYREGKPTISSYISSEGKRKIVFAAQSSAPIEIGGVAYTGLAVSYDNEVIEGLITSNVFDGASDCYVIRDNGDVVLSLAPKSEFTDYIANMFTFLDDSVSFERGSVEDMRSDIGTDQPGSALCDHSGNSDIIVWRASSTQDWTIVGVVHDKAVNSGMKDIQSVTFVVVTGLFLCTMVLVIGGVVLSSRRRLHRKEQERAELEHQKRLSDELFEGVTKIVDRIAICDLENDAYEYREHEFNEPLYPESGRYQDFVEALSKRYVVTSDLGNVKMGTQLSPDHLREVLPSEGAVARFEYAGRDGDVYKVMSMVPVEWGTSGELKKVLLCCQDIGRRVELENITRTDGLTGLFNERCFAEVLHKRQTAKRPFTLLYLDLDRFKPVNDTYGHDAGDQLLKEVAHRIQGCIRDEDFAFRIGGDEFAIVLSAQLDDDQLRERIFKLKEVICEPIEVDGHEVTVGTSCGWARLPFDSDNASTVRKLADKRMYEDKERNHAGR